MGIFEEQIDAKNKEFKREYEDRLAQEKEAKKVERIEKIKETAK